MTHGSEAHDAGCEGCQILGLIAERDALQAKIDAAPHGEYCMPWRKADDPAKCVCWKSAAPVTTSGGDDRG